jgi:hypothetical protein
MRRYLASPRRLRRLAWGLIVTGGFLAALAVVLRDRLARGEALFNASYLLDAAWVLLAIAGAVLEARVGALFLAFAPAPARRRAVLETVVGLVVALGGCVGLGAVQAEGIGVLLRPLLAGALAAGLGVGLAGIFTLAWFYGVDWAAGRMERLDQPEIEEFRRRPEQERR